MTIVHSKRVLVIGGGIAGTVCALALRRAGHDPLVFEAYERSSDGVGAFLTLAENGLAALGVLGLESRLGHLGMDTPAMTLVSGYRGQLGTFPMKGRTIARSDLYTALRDEVVRQGIEVRYGKRLETVTPQPDGVLAHFGDGTFEAGDLLVGADGLRSRTRALIDPRAPQARYLGLLNTGGYAEGPALTASASLTTLVREGDPGVAHFVFGRQCFYGYFIHPDRDAIWWFANPPRREGPSRQDLAEISPGQWRERLEQLFDADDGPILDLIAATDDLFAPWATYDFPTVPHWFGGGMVLIGDAVHAVSPSSGQGASLAIEDAVVLAQCLRDEDDTATAFARYQALRRSRVERVVRQGKRSGDGKAQGPLGSWFRDRMLPMAMSQMTRRGTLNWMTDYRIAWD